MDGDEEVGWESGGGTENVRRRMVMVMMIFKKTQGRGVYSVINATSRQRRMSVE